MDQSTLLVLLKWRDSSRPAHLNNTKAGPIVHLPVSASTGFHGRGVKHSLLADVMGVSLFC